MIEHLSDSIHSNIPLAGEPENLKVCAMVSYKLSSNCCISSSHRSENTFESRFVKFKLDRKDKTVLSMTITVKPAGN